MKWERTFELSASPDVVWRAFSAEETEEPKVFRRDNAYLSRGAVTIDISREEPGVALEWTESEGSNRWDMVVTFTQTETGTSVTVVRSGFGDDDDWLLAGGARFLGWQWVMSDLEIYFRTGQSPNRFYRTPFVSAGVNGVDDGGGVRVVRVLPGSVAEQAGVQRGDIVISFGGAPVFGLQQLWSLPCVLSGEVEIEFVRGTQILSGRGVLEAAA
jgi:hypothetical protein